ncbi:MAG: 2-oxoacid:acceptor oxidoreductase subunit alpha [Candidatus Taylorbacteria bacterium]|nr:2-oxoacid:acceptor oxidoreductase subunit alpha [Candidatus Taylorbacteria bacterium]
MKNDPHNDNEVFTVGLGGAAGDGVREAGQNLGILLTDLGYEVFLSFTYPSLIRGGHNFARISFSKEKIWTDHEKLDVLIALNEESVKKHVGELNKDAVIFADSFDEEDKKTFGENAVELPMSASSKELGVPPITRNSVAVGALCYLLDLHFPTMQKILDIVFRDKKLGANIKLADIGFEFMKKMNFRHTKKIDLANASVRTKKIFTDGNSAFGKGLLAAGLDFYISYPMTPSTGILHYLAGEQKKVPTLKVIQPENEISVINMALGMAYAGKRVAIGSATGGFALMQEAFSFSGMAELPLVVAVSQRQAPATGVPTFSSQTDLRFAIHSGHGEFPRIVLAPGDTEEAFLAGANALNLAWKYQVPVIVLLDKILSEHSATSAFDGANGGAKIKIEKGKIWDGKNGAGGKGDDGKAVYGRYEVTEDGISPLAFPGTPNAVVKITSYEHDEAGITAEEAEPVKKMVDKRFAKKDTLVGDLKNQETVKVYGDKNSENVLVFWGSTKGPVMEASKYFDKPVKMVQVVWMEPFDSERVKQELSGAKKIIDIECNHDAELASLIREKTGILIADKILKYDSRPLDPVVLAEEINKFKIIIKIWQRKQRKQKKSLR